MAKTYEKKTKNVLLIKEMVEATKEVDIDILNRNIASTEAQLVKLKELKSEVEIELDKIKD